MVQLQTDLLAELAREQAAMGPDSGRNAELYRRAKVALDREFEPDLIRKVLGEAAIESGLTRSEVKATLRSALSVDGPAFKAHPAIPPERWGEVWEATWPRVIAAKWGEADGNGKRPKKPAANRWQYSWEDGNDPYVPEHGPFVGLVLPPGTILLDVDDMEAFDATDFDVTLDVPRSTSVSGRGMHFFYRLHPDRDYPVAATGAFPGADTKVGGTGISYEVGLDAVEQLGTPDTWPLAPDWLQPGERKRVFRSVSEYLEGVPKDVPWLWHPFAYFGGVSMIAGIWKGGKSQLVSGLIRSRAAGAPFLEQDLPPGPIYLITEEGGVSMVEKYDGSATFNVVDARDLAFGNLTLWDAIADIEKDAPVNALVVVDTFIALSAVEDENDSAEITAAIRKLMVFAQKTEAAVIIIDHVGKQTSGLNHGKSIRGSGAKPATLDIYGVLDYGPTPTRRSFTLEGRVRDARGVINLDFDPETQEWTQLAEEASQTQYDKWLAGIPLSGYTLKELEALWELSRNPVRARAQTLIAAGRMRKEYKLGGGQKAWVYLPVLAPWTHPLDEEEDE